MKKLIISLLIISLIIMAGCSAKEDQPAVEEPSQPVEQEPAPEAVEDEPETETESEPAPETDGPAVAMEDSQTVKFYSNLFDSDQYTIIQRMHMVVGDFESDSISIVARDGDQYVTKTEYTSGDQTSGIRIILRDGKSYSIDDQNKTYWVSEASEEVDYEVMTGDTVESLRLQEFITGQSEVDGVMYDTETYVDQGIIMTYYFQNGDMKFFENGTEDSMVRVYIDRATTDIDPELFIIPDDYEESQGVG
jgi:hypothetical protein